MGLGRTGIAFDGVEVDHPGLVEMAHFDQQIGEIDPRIGVVGPEFDGTQEAPPRVLPLAQFPEHVAEIVVRRR